MRSYEISYSLHYATLSFFDDDNLVEDNNYLYHYFKVTVVHWNIIYKNEDVSNFIYNNLNYFKTMYTDEIEKILNLDPSYFPEILNDKHLRKILL